MDFKEFRRRVREIINAEQPPAEATIHLKRRPGGSVEIMCGMVSPAFFTGARVSNHNITVKDFLYYDKTWRFDELGKRFSAMLDEVTNTEYGYRLDELIGASDVADILGWDVRKVWSYANSGKEGFPQPVGLIGHRSVWYIKDIEEFKKARRV